MDINALLTAYALEEAEKDAIKKASPYSGFADTSNQISDSIIKLSADPKYDTKDAIIAGLVSGLVGGGVNSLNDNWISKATDRYRDVTFDSATGKQSERDFLPLSVFDAANEKGGRSRLKSVFDSVKSEQELENALKLHGAKGAIDNELDFKQKQAELRLEKPWLFEEGEQSEPLAMIEGVSPEAGEEGDFEWNPLAEQVSPGGENTIDQKVRAGLRRGEFESPADGYKYFRDQEAVEAERKREAEKGLFGSEDSFRQEISKIPSVQQFTSMQASIPRAKAFKDQNTKSSDVGFVYNYVKALDEGAVKEGEINLANTSVPLLQQYSKYLQSVYSNKSQLTPKIKNQMFRELVGAQAGVYDQAKRDAAVIAKIAESRGITNNIYPFDTNLSFGDTPTGSALETRLAEGLRTEGPTGAFKALTQEYFSKFGDNPDTRAMVKKAWAQLEPRLGGR